jgi:hypothetical protein
MRKLGSEYIILERKNRIPKRMWSESNNIVFQDERVLGLAGMQIMAGFSAKGPKAGCSRDSDMPQTRDLAQRVLQVLF